ncbi:MAG: alpha/beta hydrolase [Pseudomonadales bacterium]|nr:alpha/beta hydrolase [Pseudomonadales bacterium]
MNQFISIRFLTTILLSFLYIQSAQATLGKWLYETNRSMEAWIAGLDERTTEVEGDVWHYYVKGDQKVHDTCTVLVHGFTAEGSHWFRFARHLDSHCIIIPDLPAFGTSSYTSDKQYTAPAQAERLHQFLSQLNISSKFNFAGSSMGGHIITTYALMFPDQVKSLALFNAGGVTSPSPSEMDIQVKQTGKSLFEVESIDDYRAMFSQTMSDPPWMPGMVMEYIAEETIKRTPRHRVIFSQTYKRDLLDQRLKEIQAPTMIIWGEEDKLLHKDMVAVFANGIQNSQTVTLPGVGHLPFLEQPGDTADIYSKFIKTDK